MDSFPNPRLQYLIQKLLYSSSLSRESANDERRRGNHTNYSEYKTQEELVDSEYFSLK
jgi:hypothetical protein